MQSSPSLVWYRLWLLHLLLSVGILLRQVLLLLCHRRGRRLRHLRLEGGVGVVEGLLLLLRGRGGTRRERVHAVRVAGSGNGSSDGRCSHGSGTGNNAGVYHAGRR